MAADNASADVSAYSELDSLARALAEQALSIRPKAKWVSEALKHPLFADALKKAHTGASATKAFEPGSLTRQVVLETAVNGGIGVLAVLRPDTGVRGADLGMIDPCALRQLQKELGPV